VLHTLLQLVPNGVRMVRAGHLEKLLEVIGWLPCLVLEIPISNGDVFLVIVIGLLIIVVAGSDHNSLGLPLRTPLVAFGATLGTLVVRFEWSPSTAAWGTFPSPWMKMVSTASLPEACLVAMLSTPFVVFGWS
jgi:hypothetical protein